MDVFRNKNDVANANAELIDNQKPVSDKHSWWGDPT